MDAGNEAVAKYLTPCCDSSDDVSNLAVVFLSQPFCHGNVESGSKTLV